MTRRRTNPRENHRGRLGKSDAAPIVWSFRPVAAAMVAAGIMRRAYIPRPPAHAAIIPTQPGATSRVRLLVWIPPK